MVHIEKMTLGISRFKRDFATIFLPAANSFECTCLFAFSPSWSLNRFASEIFFVLWIFGMNENENWDERRAAKLPWKDRLLKRISRGVNVGDTRGSGDEWKSARLFAVYHSRMQVAWETCALCRLATRNRRVIQPPCLRVRVAETASHRSTYARIFIDVLCA